MEAWGICFVCLGSESIYGPRPPPPIKSSCLKTRPILISHCRGRTQLPACSRVRWRPLQCRLLQDRGCAHLLSSSLCLTRMCKLASLFGLSGKASSMPVKCFLPPLQPSTRTERSMWCLTTGMTVAPLSISFVQTEHPSRVALVSTRMCCCIATVLLQTDPS